MLGSTSSLVSEEDRDVSTTAPHHRYRPRGQRAMKNIRYHRVPGFASTGPDRDILNYAYGSETNLERYVCYKDVSGYPLSKDMLTPPKQVNIKGIHFCLTAQMMMKRSKHVLMFYP